MKRPNIAWINNNISKPGGFHITCFGSHIDSMKDYEVGVLITHESTPREVFSERYHAYRDWTPEELTPERRMRIFMELEPPMYKIPDEVLAGYLDAAIKLLCASILTKFRMDRK